ncbi:MAG: hypothetical protein DWQ47_15125 [Acidobacteria bacterium]|nr:MAG: hypothetical protein DWQ32_02525 [Acidobacteriota bacterium]REK02604.1 MAG: hypothetical protein DWQ38_09610 [Acidobacteriota bacterium]REK13593.1 MAG: hypothetical protein DWQ43_08215 [Acidobacteriota bacterium]REK41587.1 MAG: hypothetical protein DWQ47_15125 [Acidobacteriota bacterium]
MNNDYLWDKKGSDPEVESLESLLTEFRAVPEAVPPAAEIPEQKTSVAGALRMAFASLSFASVAIVAAGLFFFGSAFQQPQAVSIDLDGAGRTAASEIPDSPSLTVSPAPPVVKPLNLTKKSKQIVNRRKSPKEAVAAVPAADQLAALTDEEREAYEKLVLALSVTTSSFKLVQDKVDGTYAGNDAASDSNTTQE